MFDQQFTQTALKHQFHLLGDHGRIVSLQLYQQRPGVAVRSLFLPFGQLMDRVRCCGVKAAGGDKQATWVTLLLNLLCQNMIARQQFLLRLHRLILQYAATPFVDLAGMILQAIMM